MSLFPASSIKHQTDLLTKCGLENVIDLIPMAVYCCDLEGNIVYYNQQATQVWGRSPNTGEVIEKFCGSYKIYNLDGSYLPHEHCPMGKAVLERLPAYQGEIIIEKPDHSWVYAKAHIRSLTDENGEIIGAINCLKDVSTERELHQAYQTTTENFRFLADGIPQLVWMANLEGEIDYYNQNWLNYSGFSLEKLKANGWSSITHPQDLALIHDSWQQSVQTSDPFTVTIRLKRGIDQSYRWFLVKAILMRSQQGERIRWFGTCTDIHNQKEAEDALRQNQKNLKDFLENANIGLHWVNADGIIVWANKAEYEMLGYSREEYIGKSIANFHADAAVIEDILHRLSCKQSLEDYSAQLLCKDGTIKEVFISSSVLWENDQFIHTRCFTRDVTAQKQAEQQLKEKNKALERVNQKLLTINNQLDTFVYAASHDLKAPIANLEGLVNFLEETISKEVIDKNITQRTFNFIAASIIKLKSTIHNLSDITHLQKNLEKPTDVEQINISDVVTEVTEEMAGLIQETQAVIQSDFKQVSILQFSRTSLKSILYNLISNGIKYKDPQRIPLLQIRTERKGSGLLLIVADNGLGFPEHAQDKIFTLFKRFHTHVEGSGMGLYIVKKIVENSGGSIMLDSKLGEGSTFRISLPS